MGMSFTPEKNSNDPEKFDQNQTTNSAGKEPFALKSNSYSEFDGIFFAFQKNARDSYVIPSTKNFLVLNYLEDTTIQIRVCKFDPGATKSCFHFQSTDQMEYLLSLIPSGEKGPNHGSLSLIEARSAAGISISLKIRFTSSRSASFRFACDLFPHSPAFNVKTFLFGLCAEDLQFILNARSSIHDRFSIEQIQKLQTYYDGSGKTLKRREWALIGNDIHGECGVVKSENVYFICDKKCHDLASWDYIDHCEEKFTNKGYLNLDKPDVDDLHHVVNDIVQPESPNFSQFS